jgi:hypothetical protein
MGGRRETRTAGPIGLRVVATEQAGLQVPASRPHVSAVLQGPTTYTASLERFAMASCPLPSGYCVPGLA